MKTMIKKQLTTEKLIKYAMSAFLSVAFMVILPEVPFFLKMAVKNNIKMTMGF